MGQADDQKWIQSQRYTGSYEVNLTKPQGRHGNNYSRQGYACKLIGASKKNELDESPPKINLISERAINHLHCILVVYT